MTTIQTRKNGTNHWVLHSLFIVIIALELFFSDSQALRCQYLVLFAILLDSMYVVAWAGRMQLSMCLHTAYRER